MKKILFILAFMLTSIYAHAQSYGGDYIPVTRPPIGSSSAQYDTSYGGYSAPSQSYYQHQPQVSYQTINAVTKSGNTAPFRIKYVDGRMMSVEYYQSYNGWSRCYEFSRTHKSLIGDDYEQAYNYRVKPTYDSAVYYF